MGIDHHGPIEAGDGEKIGSGRCRTRTVPKILGKSGLRQHDSAPDDALFDNSGAAAAERFLDLAGLSEAQLQAIRDVIQPAGERTPGRHAN
jgi:hypothetical protein